MIISVKDELLWHHRAKFCTPTRELPTSYRKVVIFEVGCCTCARDRLFLGQPTCLAIEGRRPVSDSSRWQMPREDVNDRKACSDTSPEIPEASWTKDTISIFKVHFSFTAVCKANCVKKHTLLFYKLPWYFNLILPSIATAPSSPLLCHPDVTGPGDPCQLFVCLVICTEAALVLCPFVSQIW